MATADEMRKRFFAPVSKPAQRTTVARMGKPSPDYGFGNPKSSGLLDQALETVRGMPTGPGSFKGEAGKARSQTRQIKQARMLADIMSGAHDTQTKERGAIARTRMGEIGANRRMNIAQTGQTLRERISQAGQDRRLGETEAGKMDREKFSQGMESGRQAMRSGTQSAINQRNVAQRDRGLSERIRQYDETKRDKAIDTMMYPEEGEGIPLEDAVNKYRNELDIRRAGSPGEINNLRRLQQIDAMSPEEKAYFDRMTPKQKKTYLGQ